MERVLAAEELAIQAALSRNIVVREARRTDLEGIVSVFSKKLGASRGPDRTLLHALMHTGNIVIVALDGAEVIGASLAFNSSNQHDYVYSHITTVRSTARDSGVGFALKLRQRAVCLKAGVTEIRWVFDPMNRRNARFNMSKLGAEVCKFHLDFYGLSSQDEGFVDRTDRFEVKWRLDSARTERALAGGALPVWQHEQLLELPEDYDELKVHDPKGAIAARLDSRRIILEQFALGRRPECDSQNRYVFTKQNEDFGSEYYNGVFSAKK